MSPHETPEQLEHAIDQLARELPLRRAPQSLSVGVLAAIERRAAQPWWRKDFLHWPVAARLFFLLCACVPAVLACLAAGRFDGELNAASARVAAAAPFTTVHALGTAVRLVANVFSSEWLLGGALAITAVYGFVFGLSAAGYRVLYARR
jgi:hypothetical protein